MAAKFRVITFQRYDSTPVVTSTHTSVKAATRAAEAAPGKSPWPDSAQIEAWYDDRVDARGTAHPAGWYSAYSFTPSQVKAPRTSEDARYRPAPGDTACFTPTGRVHTVTAVAEGVVYFTEYGVQRDTLQDCWEFDPCGQYVFTPAP